MKTINVQITLDDNDVVKKVVVEGQPSEELEGQYWQGDVRIWDIPIPNGEDSHAYVQIEQGFF